MDLVRARLAGLDGDFLEFVVSRFEDGEYASEDSQEQVRELLVSADFCGSEEEAKGVVKELVDMLGGGAAAAKDNASGAEDMSSCLPKRLDKVLTFGDTEVDDKQFKAVMYNNDAFETTGEAKITKGELRAREREARYKAELAAKTQEQAEAKVGLGDLQIMATFSMNGGDSGNGNLTLDRFDLPHKLGGNELLTNASVSLVAGRRYGLVGRNGCGKSTFLEAFNAKQLDGMKDFSQSVLLVKQEVEGNPLSPIEWVLGSDGRQAWLRKALERDPGQIALQEQLAELERTKGETEAAKILHGLGFSHEMMTKPTASLSGGWRRRVALACGLFVEPDFLLLDEPTNHIDLEALLWLEHYLLSDKFSGTLLVVSHDRSFLTAVCTDIIQFHAQKLTQYRGDFVSYLEQVEQERSTKAKQREVQEARRAHLQEYIDKHAKAKENGPKAAKQRKSRMKKLDRLGVESASQAKGGKFKLSYDGEAEEVEEEVDEDEFELCFPYIPKVDGVLILLENMAFAYPNACPLLEHISCNFDMSSRVGILGRNGCGKSTLLKVLLNMLEPTAGKVTVKQQVRIEYIAQHSTDALDLDSSPLETMLEAFPGDGSMSHVLDMRRYLAAFGLQGNVLPRQKIRKLSGGQKFRVQLAISMYTNPHFLVLDEPTNHLDVATVNAVIAALKNFSGGFCVVSHDEYFLSQTCKDFYVISNNKFSRSEGGFQQYKKLCMQGKA